MNQRRKVKFAAVFIAVIGISLVALALFGCHKADEFKAADDEIALQIKLDVKEDIGLILVDYAVNDSQGSGGISNADKTMLKHDELIIYTLNKQNFDNAANIENLTIQLTIVTKYIDPNYENVYPAEYTKPIDAIPLKANYGESYFITVSGDKTNGYKAVLEH